MIKYLFLLIPFITFAQPGGQVSFSAAQRDSMLSRRTSGPYKTSSTGIFGDYDYMISESSDFNTTPAADRFDYMSSTTPIPWGNPDGLPFDAVPINTAAPGNDASDNIHYAAIEAWLTDNSTLGQKVIDQILLRAKDDDLDFGNGTGANNPNATYGTTIRWDDDHRKSNPFFFAINKVTKYLESYALLSERGLYTLSSGDQTRLDGWFADAKTWADAKLSNYYRQALGVNWEAYNFSSTGWNSASAFTDPILVTSDGTEITGYRTSQIQQLTFANVAALYAKYLLTYGLLYNDTDAVNFGKRWFEDYYRFGCFSDGTTFELHRATNTTPILGMSYWAISMGIRAKMAAEYALADINALPVASSISNPFAMLDFTTSEGWSDYLVSYTQDDTAGGAKGLKLEMESFSKYINDEWTPSRHHITTGIPLISMTTRFHYIGSVALANSYYDDPNLKNLYKGINGDQAISTGAGTNAGSWQEATFGPQGIYLMSYGLYWDMEGRIFGASVAGQARNKRAFLNAFYDN